MALTSYTTFPVKMAAEMNAEIVNLVELRCCFYTCWQRHCVADQLLNTHMEATIFSQADLLVTILNLFVFGEESLRRFLFLASILH